LTKFFLWIKTLNHSKLIIIIAIDTFNDKYNHPCSKREK
jgi:hypothetical protein